MRGDDIALLSGLERLTAGLAAAGGMVPFNELVGIRLREAQYGSATREMRPPEWLARRAATSPAGAASVLADAALGSAVLSMLPPGRVHVSTRLDLDVSPAAPEPWETLVCPSVVAEMEGDLALSTGEVRTETGALVARATLWTAILDMRAPAEIAGEGVADPGTDAADDAGVPAASGLSRAGVAALHVSRLEARDGEAVVTVDPHVDLSNSAGHVHGGAISVLADVAIGEACATLPGSPLARPFHFSVDYLRPTRMEGPVEYRARVVQASARIAFAEADTIDATGRLTARVTGRCLLER